MPSEPLTAAPACLTLDDGQLTVVAEFHDTLRAAGLETVAQFLALPSAAVVRAVPGRSTIRLELPGLVGYLKRYAPEYLSPAQRWRRTAHWPGADDEAAREWDNLQRLRAAGIRTAVPVALGQRRVGGVVVASFLLQQEIPNGKPADEYLLGQPRGRRRQLLAQIGQLARQLHDAGFIHKDLYLKHVFVAERGVNWELHLIDLQRVLGPRRHRPRWYRKDLAALASSARRHVRLSRTDLLRLYHGFTGRARLTAADKRELRRVWRRVRRLLRRTPRYKRVWNA